MMMMNSILIKFCITHSHEKNLTKCNESHFPTDWLNKDSSASTHLYCYKTIILHLEFGSLSVSLAL
jgi:hypothetical protein